MGGGGLEGFGLSSFAVLFLTQLCFIVKVRLNKKPHGVIPSWFSRMLLYPIQFPVKYHSGAQRACPSL